MKLLIFFLFVLASLSSAYFEEVVTETPFTEVNGTRPDIDCREQGRLPFGGRFRSRIGRIGDEEKPPCPRRPRQAPGNQGQGNGNQGPNGGQSGRGQNGRGQGGRGGGNNQQ